MDAYPDGIVATDNFGRFPFVNRLIQWVYISTNRIGLDDQDSAKMESFMNFFRNHRHENNINPFQSMLSQFSIESPPPTTLLDTASDGIITSNRPCLEELTVGPISEWSFLMLSTALDHAVENSGL
jgi:hypothetical protein